MSQGPEIVPTQQEVDDEAKREARRKQLRQEEIANETATPDELLARIEPEGQEFYRITQRLSNALLLSIAISTKRQADAEPVPVSDEAAWRLPVFKSDAKPKKKRKTVAKKKRKK